MGPWGELYASRIYPTLSAALSWLASPLPFSLTELVALIFLGTALLRLWQLLFRPGRGKTVLRLAGLLLSAVVWFYAGWGLNYFRDSIYTRSGTTAMPFEEAEFREFLTLFTEELNESRCVAEAVDPARFEQETKDWYTAVPAEFGLCRPRSWQHPKRLLLNRLYSAVGVLGFLGPAFDEMQLNRELTPLEYPFVFAHEYAHVLGVSSEAEANFWAFERCRASDDPTVHYSAWFMLLNYTAANIRSLLGEEAYEAWLDDLPPEVFDDLDASQAHWRALRWTWLADLQHKFYDFFLRSNQIPEGTKNYGQVLRLVFTFSDFHGHSHGEEG